VNVANGGSDWSGDSDFGERVQRLIDAEGGAAAGGAAAGAAADEPDGGWAAWQYDSDANAAGEHVLS